MSEMGADRYSVCVRCDAERAKEIAKREDYVATAYGVVTVDKFDELRTELESFKADGTPAEFRENWEIITPEGDGELRVTYRGSCGTCGLLFELDETYQIWPDRP